MELLDFLEKFREHLINERIREEEKWRVVEALKKEFEYLKKHQGRDLYSCKELAEKYSKSESTIWRRIKDFEIPYRGKLGKTHLFSLREFEESMYITPQDVIRERMRA